MYGTNIDYPVWQSAEGDQDKHLTTDARGQYSLSGSLFMDVANAADFSDFSDGSYFLEHRYGNLFANDRDYGLVLLLPRR